MSWMLFTQIALLELLTAVLVAVVLESGKPKDKP
jgi:hypothetical protein